MLFVPWLRALKSVWKSRGQTPRLRRSLTLPIANQPLAASHRGSLKRRATSLVATNIEYLENRTLLSVTATFVGAPANELLIVSTADDGVRVTSSGGTVEVRLDDPTGPLLGSVSISSTGGWQNWQTLTGAASGTSGVQSLYVVFQGGRDPPRPLVGGAGRRRLDPP